MTDGNSGETSLEKKLHELELQFAIRLPGKMLEMQQMMQTCINEKPDQHNLYLLHRLFHSMAGSAGIFGFAELGKRAQVLEIEVKSLVDLPEWPLARLEKIAQDLDALRVWVQQNSEHVPESAWLK